MSLHRSLRTKPNALNQHRNVLTRAERIVLLTEQARFDPETASPLGLVKVAHRAVATRKKEAKAKEAVEGTEAAAGAPPA